LVVTSPCSLTGPRGTRRTTACVEGEMDADASTLRPPERKEASPADPRRSKVRRHTSIGFDSVLTEA
jgi:hypothetical protein